MQKLAAADEKAREFLVTKSMSSRDRKRVQLYKKLQQLRAATNSSSADKTSIIVDASKYIEDLKQKVDLLNQEIGSSETANQNLPNMEVSVETLEKGFRINVYSERKCPGLLVSVLEAFEELGLDVLDANVSCADSFHFEAVGSEDEAKDVVVDAQVLKQAVLQAINSWSGT